MALVQATTQDLLAFIEQSPTPYHCVEQVKERLVPQGFVQLSERDEWKLSEGGRYFVQRDGAVVALVCGESPAVHGGLRLIGAHTDSPNLRVKPAAGAPAAGYAQLGVEVYGGALTYTWLDRDLGLAGRVVTQSSTPGGAVGKHLVCLKRPCLRIPSLAIHLNRGLRDEGLKLNAQNHLQPIFAFTKTPEDDGLAITAMLREVLAEQLDIAPEKILGWELCLMDLQPPALGGLAEDMIFAPRLDNQAMCHAGIVALLRSLQNKSVKATRLVALYDHEEVGSESVSGAGGSLVEDILRRLVESEGPGAQAAGLPRAVANSFQLSADMAHAIHPNYQDRHEPQHWPMLNGGPVIKVNSNQRYATNAEGAGVFEAICRELAIPCQKFVNRTDLACGSTIGPIASARLGVRTVDVGNAMLSMHSIREHAGALDPEHMVRAMERFLTLESL